MDKLYTLKEAVLELAKRECGSFGHSYNYVETNHKGLVGVICDRCGKYWSVNA